MENFENFRKDSPDEDWSMLESALDIATSDGVSGKSENYAVEAAAAKKPFPEIAEKLRREQEKQERIEIIEEDDERIKKMMDSSPRIRDHIERLRKEKSEIVSRSIPLEEKDNLITAINKKIADYFRVLSEQHIQADEQSVAKRELKEDEEEEEVRKFTERLRKKNPPKNISDPNYRFEQN